LALDDFSVTLRAFRMQHERQLCTHVVSRRLEANATVELCDIETDIGNPEKIICSIIAGSLT
jgi:hypothetical protein